MISEIVLKTRNRILPLVGTIGVALGFSLLGINSGFFNFTTAFIPEGQGGFDPLIGLLNAAILILIALFGAFMIYLLLKYDKDKILKYFFIGSFIFIGSFMIFLFGLSLLNLLAANYLFLFIIVLLSSFGIGILLSLMIFYKRFSKNRNIKNIGLLIFGALIGSFLGLVLPTWTSFLLLIGLSIYDIFAVFKGPIKKIIELNEEKNKEFCEVSYALPDYEIGLGDLTFYSMLACSTLRVGYNTSFINEWGLLAIFLPCIMSIIGIIIGALITFKLLEKKEILPGLPISILLGIGLFGIIILIFWFI